MEERNALIAIEQPSDAPIVTRDPERNVRIARYTRAEHDLYASGTNDVVKFAEHASMWTRLANDDGTINSAYGKIVWYDQSLPGMRTPWQWAFESLKRDHATRQAVLLFMRPDHLRECKDVVCTSHGTFHIRNEALHLTMVMRSNDVVRGMVYDIPWFCRLQLTMLDELLPTYPNLKLGSYSHFVHSLHLYDSDIEIARRMVHGSADV